MKKRKSSNKSCGGDKVSAAARQTYNEAAAIAKREIYWKR